MNIQKFIAGFVCIYCCMVCNTVMAQGGNDKQSFIDRLREEGYSKKEAEQLYKDELASRANRVKVEKANTHFRSKNLFYNNIDTNIE